jgi:alanine racemase
MASTSKIQIKYQALENNVKFIREMIGPHPIISAVIKGNAYGHGTEVIVPALEEIGVNHFSVYSSPEAIVACKIKKPDSTIMIMGYVYPQDFDWILQNKIEFYISDVHTAEKALAAASVLNKQAIVHLDLETGMNRTGLSLKDLKKVCTLIKDNQKYFKIKGITSHFAGAESIANYTRITKQQAIFKKRLKYLDDMGMPHEITHLASSAATINYPDTRMDLIRAGVMLYGYWPTRETFINYVHRKMINPTPCNVQCFGLPVW